MLLKIRQVNDEIKEEIKYYLQANDNESTTIQKYMGVSKSTSQREVHTITVILKKTEISNDITYNLKELEKEEQANVKSEEKRLKTSGQAHQEEKRGDPNKENKK